MMESRFDMSNFERSLKEHADRFTIVPSERVWKGIYNDLHPGSKWPSLAMGLLMIITLFWMGNNQKNQPEELTAANENTIQPVTTHSKQSSNNIFPENRVIVPKTNEISETVIKTDILEPGQTAKVVAMQDYKRSLPLKDKAEKILEIPVQPGIAGNDNLPINRKVSSLLSEEISSKSSLTPLSSFVNNENSILDFNTDRISIVEAPENNQDLPGLFTNSTNGNESLKTQSNTTQLNAMLKKKKQSNLEWIFYVAPSLTTVHFEGNNLNTPASMNGNIVITPISKHSVITKPKFGLEAGVDVNYKLNEKIAVTSGAHASYSGYKIVSSFVHPTLTTVTFEDSKGNYFNKNYMTHYGNGRGMGKFMIQNYNLQFAVPVGLQWNLWANDDMKVSVVSTIEPFLVLGSRAYILSGDGNNYVNDPSLLRRVNLNGNFSSMFSFHGAGVNWHIGPNVKYQVFSTYHNIYPVREHLINYEFKIGISKRK